MNTNASQTILDKIKGENIKPKARWYFVVKHAALWVPVAIVTFVGALAVAGELYAIRHAGWDYRDFVYPSQTDFILAMVPYIWVISFVFFGIFIVKSLRTTYEGYRLSLKTIVFGSIATSIVLGVVIYVLDETFQADSVIRYPVREREMLVWFSPNQGRLSGIVEKKYESDIQLRDKDNTLWTIDMSGFGSTTFSFIKEGKSIRVVGVDAILLHQNNKDGGTEEIDGYEHEFIACAVFPWDIGGFTRGQIDSTTTERRARVSIQNQNQNCQIILDTIRQHTKGE